MPRHPFIPFVLIALWAVLPHAPALANATSPTEDIAGAKDLPWLKRYEGSFIVSYEQRRFDAMVFPASKLLVDEDSDVRDDKNNRIAAPKRKVVAEGAYTRLLYVAPEDRSPLEVIRNYIDEIKGSGGRLLYGCQDLACGGPMNSVGGGGDTQSLFDKLYPPRRMKDDYKSNGDCAATSDLQEQRYVLARMADGSVLGVMVYSMSDDLYCKAFNDRTGVLVVAVEPKARDKKMVTVTADDMAQALDAEGRISLYGIYFDFNKSLVKPESRPTLEQIATLLKARPKLALDVVGHTDNVGGAEFNQSLSERRAAAVVTALVEDYGIAGSRLRPSGAGLRQPVASNAAEAGRAKNRRVELIKR